MTRMILSGCSGNMGRTVSACAAERGDFEIVAGIDRNRSPEPPYPVFSDPEEITAEADVLVDFSSPVLLSTLLEFGKKRRLPLVLCTTGYGAEQVEAMGRAADEIPIFYSRNMSMGINLLLELVKKAERVLGADFDVEIVETHHSQKLDAPSGTALMIADAVSEASGSEMHYLYDRHSQRKKRERDEIGIHSVRGGTVVGEHQVIFAGPQEVLTITHSAQSREVFALGALHAAVFLSHQAAGLYSMADLIHQEGSK